MDPVQVLSIEMEKFQLQLDEPIYETLPEKRSQKKSATSPTRPKIAKSFRNSFGKHFFNSIGETKERKPPLPKRNKSFSFIHEKDDGDIVPFFHQSFNNIYTSNEQNEHDSDYCRIKKDCAICEPIYIDIDLLEEIRNNLHINTNNNNANKKEDDNAVYTQIDSYIEHAEHKNCTWTCIHSNVDSNDDDYYRRPSSFSHNERTFQVSEQCPYSSHVRCGSAPSKSSKTQYIVVQKEKKSMLKTQTQLPKLLEHTISPSSMKEIETDIIYEDIAKTVESKHSDDETYVYMGSGLEPCGTPCRIDKSDENFSFRSLSSADKHYLDDSSSSLDEDSDEYYIYDEITPIYGNVCNSLDETPVSSSNNKESCIYGNMATSSPINMISGKQQKQQHQHPIYDNLASSTTSTTNVAFSKSYDKSFSNEFCKELIYTELPTGQKSFLTGSLRDHQLDTCDDRMNGVYASIDVEKTRGLTKAIEKSRKIKSLDKKENIELNSEHSLVDIQTGSDSILVDKVLPSGLSLADEQSANDFSLVDSSDSDHLLVDNDYITKEYFV